MTIYLYKKTHNKTGLQYLGKTSQKDPHKYRGSGNHWVPHIKKHGYDVTTEILRECQTNEEVKEWGLYYSELWNVVEDDSWANLKPESGDGGITVYGDSHPMKNPDIVKKLQDWWTEERRLAQGKHTKKINDSRTEIEKQEIIQKRRVTWNKDPSNKEILSSRMTTSNPSKRDEVLDRIAKTKSEWTIEQREQILAKNSGRNHYRNNPAYISTQVGKGHPKFDPIIRTFKHKLTDEEVSMTTFDFINTYNLHQGNVSLLIRGERKHVGGWKLLD